ncbi:MAG: hypothetical protein JWM10_1544 [Myxococcaceae bacterium]|nr:hypothetical protein [Myxococcaceae bacterium]
MGTRATGAFDNDAAEIPTGALRIGVVGYSRACFDAAAATLLVRAALDALDAVRPGAPRVLVAGFTDVGVPAIAYREAARRGWRTAGVACARAHGLPCYPVDERLIVGRAWGDESAAFVAMIDALVRVGGGPQSHREVAMARALGVPVAEHELPAIDPRR